MIQEIAWSWLCYPKNTKTTPAFASSVSFCFPRNIRVKTISTNSARPRCRTHAVGLSREIFALLTEIPLPDWVSSKGQLISRHLLVSSNFSENERKQVDSTGCFISGCMKTNAY